MIRKFLTVIVLVILFSTVAAQGPTPSVTVKTITIPGWSAYNTKVSPDMRIAALFVGTTARSILGIPAAEYEPEPGLLPVRLVDLTTGQELGRLEGLTDYVGDVAFSPDGQHLVTYQLNGQITLWDVATLQPIRQISGVMGQAKLAFMPDGNTLVAYIALGMIGQFFLWDMETGHMTAVWHAPIESFGELRLAKAPENLDNFYFTFALSPDGLWLATATANGELHLWDTTTLERTLIQARSSNPAAFNVQSVGFSADGTLLYYFDRETNTTHLWGMMARSEMGAWAAGNTGLVLTPQNDAFVWGDKEGLWYVPLDQPDVATKIADIPENLVGAYAFNAPHLFFSPDGRQLVVGDWWQRESADSLLYVMTLE